MWKNSNSWWSANEMQELWPTELIPIHYSCKTLAISTSWAYTMTKLEPFAYFLIAKRRTFGSITECPILQRPWLILPILKIERVNHGTLNNDTPKPIKMRGGSLTQVEKYFSCLTFIQGSNLASIPK